MKLDRRFTSSVHTSFLLSQVCRLVLDIVKKNFPPDFFKREWISIQDRNIAEMKRQLNGVDANGGEFTKAVPAIALHPNFTLDGTLRENPKFNDWMDLGVPGFYSRMTKFGTTDIFHDYDKGRFVRSLAKEVKLTFTIYLRCETTLQTWDVMNFLKNQIIFDAYRFYNDIDFIGTIPNVIMHNLALSYGLDINKPEERAEFNKIYTLGSFNRTGREIMDFSKGHKIFGFNYRTNPIVKFNMPTSDNADGKKKKANVVMEPEVSFEGEIQTKMFSTFGLEILDVDEDIGFVDKTVSSDDFSAVISFEKKMLPLPRTLENGEYEEVFKTAFETDEKNFDLNKEIIVKDHEYLNDQFNFAKANYRRVSEDLILPIGWKINTKKGKPSLIKTSMLEDGEDKALRVEHRFGTYELATVQGIRVVPEKSYKLTFDTTNNLRNFDFVVGIHPLGTDSNISFRKEYHNTYPERRQTMDIYFGTTASKIGITIRPKNPDMEHTSVYHNISLKMVDYKVRIGDNFDKLDLSDTLPKDLLIIIDENIKQGISNDDLFKIKLIEYGEDRYFETFKFDWAKKELTMTNPKFGRIYYINFYANKSLYEKLVEVYKKRYPFLKPPFEEEKDSPHQGN